MENMRQQCPECGNWVEGKKRASYTKKLAKTGVKTAVNSAASIGAASTGAAIGSAIFPGVGTLIGGAAGFLASTMFHTAVNEGIDAIAEGTEEVLSDNIVYEFSCPKCGHEWDSNDQIDSTMLEQQEYLDSAMDEEVPQEKQGCSQDIEWFCVHCYTWVKNESYCPNCGNFVDISKFSFTPADLDKDFSMFANDVIQIQNGPVIISGIIHTGEVRRGDKVIISSYQQPVYLEASVFGVEMFRFILGRGEEGDHVGLLVEGVSYEEINSLLSSHAFVYKDDGDLLILPEIKRSMNQLHSDNSSNESEYIEEVRACLSEDGEITSRERRLLNRLREKLGISEKRAQELEDSLTTSQLTADEQEYLDEYRACLEEGGISSKERRLLDRLRDKLGIDPSRASELENL